MFSSAHIFLSAECTNFVLVSTCLSSHNRHDQHDRSTNNKYIVKYVQFAIQTETKKKCLYMIIYKFGELNHVNRLGIEILIYAIPNGVYLLRNEYE